MGRQTGRRVCLGTVFRNVGLDRDAKTEVPAPRVRVRVRPPLAAAPSHAKRGNDQSLSSGRKSLRIHIVYYSSIFISASFPSSIIYSSALR